MWSLGRSWQTWWLAAGCTFRSLSLPSPQCATIAGSRKSKYSASSCVEAALKDRQTFQFLTFAAHCGIHDRWNNKKSHSAHDIIFLSARLCLCSAGMKIRKQKRKMRKRYFSPRFCAALSFKYTLEGWICCWGACGGLMRRLLHGDGFFVGEILLGESLYFVKRAICRPPSPD